MTITEALKARGKENGHFITRVSWNEEYAYYMQPTKWPTSDTTIYLVPTSSPDCIMIQSWYEDHPCRRWQPTAGDLMAEDWVVVR